MSAGVLATSTASYHVELLEAFETAFGEPERGAVVGVVDPVAAVLGFELVGELERPFGFIIDIWKGGELVQSVAGPWEDEARRLTIYYRASLRC